MSFSKSWNCTSRFGECNFSFLKNSQVQINSKLNEKNRIDYLLIIQTWKKWNGKSAGRCFLSLFLCIRENFFQSFCTNVLSLFYMGSLDFYKISYCTYFCRIIRSSNYALVLHVLHWCYIVLHRCYTILHWCYTWTALLSANQNREIFSCVLLSMLF